MRFLRRWTSNLLFGSTLVFLMAACASFPTQAVFHPSQPSIAIKIGQQNHGIVNFRARLEAFPGAVLHGSALPGSQGSWILEINSLHWFNNWPNGWTDAQFLAEGRMTLVKTPRGWQLHIDNVPVLDSVESASIRYFDEDLVEDRGLEEFSHRWERILSTTGFLAQKFPPDWINATSKVQSFLFPEVWGYPSGVKPGTNFQVADSIAWDTSYTVQNFPKDLQAVRNGGTLLRDYEESLGLWVLAFQWKIFWQNVLPGIVFIKSS